MISDASSMDDYRKRSVAAGLRRQWRHAVILCRRAWRQLSMTTHSLSQANRQIRAKETPVVRRKPRR